MGIVQQNSFAGWQSRRSWFSLVELMLSMVILLIMMGMLLYIVSTAQKSWKLQESRTRIYQNSRVIFDLIERDVRSMVTSSVEGREIGYYVFDFDPDYITKRRAVCLVTRCEPNSESSTSRMCEVTYRLHTTTDDEDTRFVLQRQIVSNVDTVNWNFYNRPDSWYDNDNDNANYQGFEAICGGVSYFDIAFFDPSGIRTPAGDFSSVQPVRVVVSVVLFDEDLSGSEFDDIRSRTQRAFTKVFYLGHLHDR